MAAVRRLQLKMPEKVDEFMIRTFREAAKNYVRNHVHDGNFLTFMNTFIEIEGNNLHRVYRTACTLFEQSNWLVPLRTKYLSALGDAMGWNE